MGKKLRLATYMVPGYPLGLYQTYQYYLEEALGCDSYLMVESRQSGPAKDKSDPFTEDEVDIGFLCSTSYLRLEKENNKYVELLPVAPIHIHPKGEMRPVYFSEVVVRSDKASKIKLFSDLKGHTWAYNDEESLSGSISTLAHLKKLGYNATFFGQVLHSGSHHNSINMVLDKRVDSATIDSNTLEQYLTEHPEHKEELQVVASFGPLPIPPIVVNSRMSDELKGKLSQALLDMNKSDRWKKELDKYKVWGFKAIDRSLYDVESEVKEVVKGQSVHAVYY